VSGEDSVMKGEDLSCKFLTEGRCADQGGGGSDSEAGCALSDGFLLNAKAIEI